MRSFTKGKGACAPRALSRSGDDRRRARQQAARLLLALGLLLLLGVGLGRGSGLGSGGSHFWLVWVACEGLQGCGFPVLRPRDLSRLQHFPASTFPPALTPALRAPWLFLAVVCFAELAGGHTKRAGQHFPASTFPPALSAASAPLSLRASTLRHPPALRQRCCRHFLAVVSANTGGIGPALPQHFPASTSARRCLCCCWRASTFPPALSRQHCPPRRSCSHPRRSTLRRVADIE